MANNNAAKTATLSLRRVTFQSGETALAGTLFLPVNYHAGDRLPALVVTGAWMTVKEQMPTRYATEMAKRGFAALVFDFAGWGESGGRRRQFEDPARKIADIEAAVTFLKTRPEVDAARIGGLAICASSGYLVHAAANDKDIRAVALVAPWLHDRALVEETYSGKDGVAKLIARAREAEASYERTGKQTLVPAASRTDKSAIMFDAPYYTEPDRGEIPQWRNEADPAFWEGWLTFDAQTASSSLTQPFFMVHSEAAAIPKGAHRFFASLKGMKGELWLPDVTQLDFYDRPDPVYKASNAVAAHFRNTLLSDRAQGDESEVREVVEAFPRLADGRDWAGLRALFADEVDLDYTSVAGGEPARVTAEDLVAGWKTGLERYKQTKHNFSPPDVTLEGDVATATFTGQATHVRDVDGKETRWSCGGDYEYKLSRTPQGWKVSAARFRMKWEQGQR